MKKLFSLFGRRNSGVMKIQKTETSEVDKDILDEIQYRKALFYKTGKLTAEERFGFRHIKLTAMSTVIRIWPGTLLKSQPRKKWR